MDNHCKTTHSETQTCKRGGAQDPMHPATANARSYSCEYGFGDGDSDGSASNNNNNRNGSSGNRHRSSNYDNDVAKREGTNIDRDGYEYGYGYTYEQHEIVREYEHERKHKRSYGLGRDTETSIDIGINTSAKYNTNYRVNDHDNGNDRDYDNDNDDGSDGDDRGNNNYGVFAAAATTSDANKKDRGGALAVAGRIFGIATAAIAVSVVGAAIVDRLQYVFRQPGKEIMRRAQMASPVSTLVHHTFSPSERARMQFDRSSNQTTRGFRDDAPLTSFDLKTGDLLITADRPPRNPREIVSPGTAVKWLTASCYHHTAVVYVEPMTRLPYAWELVGTGPRMIPLDEYVRDPHHSVFLRRLTVDPWFVQRCAAVETSAATSSLSSSSLLPSPSSAGEIAATAAALRSNVGVYGATNATPIVNATADLPFRRCESCLSRTGTLCPTMVEVTLASQWKTRFDWDTALAWYNRFMTPFLPGAHFLRGIVAPEGDPDSEQRTCSHLIAEFYHMLGVLDFTGSGIDPASIFARDYMSNPIDRSLLPLVSGCDFAAPVRLLASPLADPPH